MCRFVAGPGGKWREGCAVLVLCPGKTLKNWPNAKIYYGYPGRLKYIIYLVELFHVTLAIVEMLLKFLGNKAVETTFIIFHFQAFLGEARLLLIPKDPQSIQ